MWRCAVARGGGEYEGEGDAAGEMEGLGTKRYADSSFLFEWGEIEHCLLPVRTPQGSRARAWEPPFTMRKEGLGE